MCAGGAFSIRITIIHRFLRTCMYRVSRGGARALQSQTPLKTTIQTGEITPAVTHSSRSHAPPPLVLDADASALDNDIRCVSRCARRVQPAGSATDARSCVLQAARCCAVQSPEMPSALFE